MVFIILGIVCVSIFYFSQQSRAETIKTRLANRSITTARLLSTSGLFDRELVKTIDSLTRLTLKDKSVQAYNQTDKRIYNYSDEAGDTIDVTPEILHKARATSSGYYFMKDDKDVVAYYYTETSPSMVVVSAAKDELGNENLDQLRTILIFSFLLGIIIASAGGYFFSNRLMSPIKRIANEVAEISAQNLARRIPTGKARDEWHEMTVTLNQLLDRLQESFELQRRFISNASHELSTPLTAISSQLEIALQRKRTPEEFERIIADVRQDVYRMNKLTQTLLEFAKAAGNKGGLNINLVRIDEILLEIPGILQKQNSIYEVFLQFDQLPDDENELLIFGNPDLLSSAVTNIVSNACKYSSDNKAIVSFSIREKDFFIDVSNQGEGVPPEEQEKIFEPFYRLANSSATAGFGLGLSLAQRIIKLHNGHVMVKSERGKGSNFTLIFPSARKVTV
jgi:signal transduction histidine kinase